MLQTYSLARKGGSGAGERLADARPSRMSQNLAAAEASGISAKPSPEKHASFWAEGACAAMFPTSADETEMLRFC